MQNSSLKNRPLIFNNKPTKADLHSMVYGNPSQAVSVSIPALPPRQAASQHPQTSLFDRYNRCNLSLRECDPQDVIIVNKNLVLHEESLSNELAESIARIASKQNSKQVRIQGKAAIQFKESPNTNQAVGDRPSKEYQQNEIFFNYQEIGNMKRQKKQEYLSEIELKVAQAEKQIAEIENIQQEQKIEIENINVWKGIVSDQIDKNNRVGELTRGIVQAGNYFSPQRQEPIHIHEQMDIQQINEVLEEHFKLNDDILERANRARSKQCKADFGASKTGQFGKTVKKPLGQQKTMMSTTGGIKNKINKPKK